MEMEAESSNLKREVEEEFDNTFIGKPAILEVKLYYIYEYLFLYAFSLWKNTFMVLMIITCSSSVKHSF